MSRELQLFDEAYNLYLSYRPEEAVEGFRKFLQEFPNSFAKDAALFWLAQSLLRMNSISEANETFASLREQFPDSPFIRYVPQEVNTTNGVKRRETIMRGAIDRKSGSTSPLVEEVGPPERAPERSFNGDANDEHAQAVSRATILSGKEGQTSLYALQVGSFKTRDSALSLRERLQKQFPTKQLTICEQGGFFKVRMTGFKNIDEANSMLGKGFDALVIKTDSTACGSMGPSLVTLPR